MSVLSILGLLMPIVEKVGGALLDRVWKHGYSTIAGTAVGATVFSVLQSNGCDFSQMDKSVITILASLPLMLSTDAGKTAPTIPQTVKEVVDSHIVNPMNP